MFYWSGEILLKECAKRLIVSWQLLVSIFFFFFQAEDGIRDRNVTGVQTCALPIYLSVLTFDFQRRRINIKCARGPVRVEVPTPSISGRLDVRSSCGFQKLGSLW